MGDHQDELIKTYRFMLNYPAEANLRLHELRSTGYEFTQINLRDPDIYEPLFLIKSAAKR